MNKAHRLLQFGIVLFLLGLITGFVIPAMGSPRLGLSAHLEGVMNGMFLILVGLFWKRLKLSERSLNLTFFALIFGTYTNWITVTLAGIWAAGGEMMPIAGGTLRGTTIQEGLVKFGLISLSLAMVYACIMIIIGLRSRTDSTQTT